MSTDAGTQRGLSDRPLGKLALLAVVLLLAFLVSRSCGAAQKDVSQSRAIEIAKTAVAFAPDRVQIRYVKRGFQSRGFWAVSLVTLNGSGVIVRTAVVLVDASTGKIAEIDR